MNELIWITVMSIVLGGAFVWAYFSGHSKGFSKAEYVNGLIERGISATSDYIQGLKDRGCDVDCVGRIPLDKRTADKLLKIGYGEYLRKQKERHIKEASELMDAKETTEPINKCSGCHLVDSCAKRGDDVTECDDFIEEAAKDEQDEREAREEVGENQEQSICENPITMEDVADAIDRYVLVDLGITPAEAKNILWYNFGFFMQGDLKGYPPIRVYKDGTAKLFPTKEYEVTDANQEAADSPQNDNHRIATEKALKASIDKHKGSRVDITA